MDAASVERTLSLYDKLKPNTSGDNYTVIATICDSKSGELIALATGTAANNRSSPDDIEDCHAESLVKRAYKRYCINKLEQILTSSSSLEEFEAQVGTELHSYVKLFISQFPCGFLKRYEGEEPLNEETKLPIKRKPGRGTLINGRLVFVEKDCCAMKLKRWIKTGIQGNKLKQLFGIHSQINELVIGDCEAPEMFDYNFQTESLRRYLAADDSIRFSSVAKIRRDDLVFDSNKQPQPVGIVWWKNESQSSTEGFQRKRRKSSSTNFEYVVDGRKKGVTKKQVLSNREMFKLRISDFHLRKDIYALEKLYIRLQK